MGRLAKIFDPNLRIYFLLEDEPRLRYRIDSFRPFQIPIPY